jgi:hypothetical protein
MSPLHEFPAVCFDPSTQYLPGMDRHSFADGEQLERLIDEAEEDEPCATT